MKCISVPWHTGASLPSTCPTPAWPSSFPVSESCSKGSVLARQGLLGDQTSRPLLLPLPQNTGQATPPDCLPGREQSRHTWAEVTGKGFVPLVLKREMYTDLGSEVDGLLGHVKPMSGGSFPINWTGTKHSTSLRKGPATASRVHPTSLTGPVGP